MKRHTASITSKSIEQSGLPSDYKKALSEYIWNGFDAGASHIEIKYDANELGYLHSFTIRDDGSGIPISNLNETFGYFLDSQKRDSFNKDGFVKGKKGKGRYAFSVFSNKCSWLTKFKGPNNEILYYTITIHKADLHNFSTSDNQISDSSSSGTVVKFEDFFDLTSDLLVTKDFKDSLAGEFGWFLFLNKEKGYHISINGKDLEYEDIIADHEEIEYSIANDSFRIIFLRWAQKIGDKYFYYFLNSDKKESYRRFTSFNNKAIDFHHSVYIQSNYFDDFIATIDENNPVLTGKNQADFSFRKLNKHLNNLVALKERQFVRDLQADKLIYEYKAKGIFPVFRNNTYDSLRQKDLESVVRELYCTEPKIFHGLNKEQGKTLVGFLNLLLDTEQREKVLDILDGIVKMSEQDRAELAKSLKKTNLSNISSMIKLLENRFTVVELLKILVFDLEKFTNERDHIQEVIESNYWLFGEQYHIVSADVNFETTLSNYLHFLELNPNKTPQKINHKHRLRRPDIFLCKQLDVPDGSSNDGLIEENIIVELKRPTVVIGKEQFSQVEDYLRFIITEPRFNSTLRKWKFLLIGKSLDSFIIDKHVSQQHKGKKFLVEAIKNYEIYALTWDDVFKQFESRHKYLINRLDFKLAVIEELQDKGITFHRKESETITNMAVSL
jgi:hypothetical protein